MVKREKKKINPGHRVDLEQDFFEDRGIREAVTLEDWDLVHRWLGDGFRDGFDDTIQWYPLCLLVDAHWGR